MGLFSFVNKTHPALVSAPRRPACRRLVQIHRVLYVPSLIKRRDVGDTIAVVLPRTDEEARVAVGNTFHVGDSRDITAC